MFASSQLNVEENENLLSSELFLFIFNLNTEIIIRKNYPKFIDENEFLFLKVHWIILSWNEINLNVQRWNKSFLKSHVMQNFGIWFILINPFVIRETQKSKVMGHYEIPFLQFVQHLYFFDSFSFLWFNTIVIDSGHVETLCASPSARLESGKLVFKVRIFVDPN